MKAWMLSLILLLSTVGNSFAQDFPPRAQQIVETLYQQHLEQANGDDDERRALTRTIIEQIVFELGSAWGGKSADPTRPFSKDSIAHIGSGGVLWGCDWQNGATRQPFRPVVCQDITGQNFIPVAGRNHLGSVPAPPTGEPIPLPPLPSVDLTPILNRLDVLLASQGSISAQNERIFQNLTAQIGDMRKSLEEHREEARQTRNKVMAFLSNWKTVAAAAGFLVGKFVMPSSESSQ